MPVFDEEMLDMCFILYNKDKEIMRICDKHWWLAAKKNYKVSKKIEKKWSFKNNKILITGHTHRPIFPKVGQGLYFNDGSCIHTNGIICLEIENGTITLVKWKYCVGDNNIICVDKEIIEGSESITNFFDNDK